MKARRCQCRSRETRRLRYSITNWESDATDEADCDTTLQRDFRAWTRSAELVRLAGVIGESSAALAYPSKHRDQASASGGGQKRHRSEGSVEAEIGLKAGDKLLLRSGNESDIRKSRPLSLLGGSLAI